MKSSLVAFAVVVAVCSAVASDGASVICLPNGDVEIENVGTACAAPRVIVELNTNADYRVVCQVYYRDNLNPLPTEMAEIEETDRIVNLFLATYLSGECWGLQPDELVEEYRAGGVFERLGMFPKWMDKAVAGIYDAVGLEKPDLTVVAVSMKAVGEFEDRLAE